MLMSPIYKPTSFADPQLKQVIWVITILLWLLSVYKMYKDNFKIVKEFVSEIKQLAHAR